MLVRRKQTAIIDSCNTEDVMIYIIRHGRTDWNDERKLQAYAADVVMSG
ncbi:MAG: hypothetical protein IJ703_01115 [Eubacterium sp.]|nr:hypothetical protein [Eubacterium sp.]